MSAPLLEVNALVKHYHRGRRTVRAVDGVSLAIERGETLALVGESGCGKSTLGRVILQLERPTSGTVRFDGEDLAAVDSRRLRLLRRRMQVIFQDPASSLNPRRSVGDSIAEGLAIHGVVPANKRRSRVATLMQEVGLDPSHADDRPHQFSGGQLQRVVIARALAVDPEFIVCDEPVSSLDVSIRAQILNLLLELRERRNLSYLFISHDLAVVRHVADRVAVMYLGTIVESGTASSIIETPRHPYTQALVSAVPSPDPARSAARIVLVGEPASPAAPPPGCPFEPRCFHPLRNETCRAQRPVLHPAGENLVACHHEA